MRASPSGASGSTPSSRQLGGMSPESHPDGFPTDEDRLAYWINAYNAFTLHAIIAEYPITLGVEDARRAVLPAPAPHRRRPRRQPRRHRARDPARRVRRAAHPLRHQLRLQRLPAAASVGLRGRAACATTLRAATEQFLGSEWNCRVDHAARRIFISRIFKMYAEDFAGAQGIDAGLPPRRAALRRPAHRPAVRADRRLRGRLQHLRLGPERRQPAAAPRADPLPRAGRALRRGDTELRELHLYEGNFCNRTCSGARSTARRTGWYQTYAPAVLDQALRHASPPTATSSSTAASRRCTPTAIIDAMAYLRGRGFRGLFTIFSNGVKADRLHRRSSTATRAARRCSTTRSTTAATPSRCRRTRKQRLEEWARAHPEPHLPGLQGALPRRRRRRAALTTATARPTSTASARGCVRCFPVLTSQGRFHACPFAAEIDAPHYDLGRVGTDPADRLPQLPRPSAAGSTTCSTPPRAHAASAAARCVTGTCKSCPSPPTSRPLTADR